MEDKYKFGYIGLVGRANAGKSSLMNSFLGQKIAIVSSKPQTTRSNMLGIYTTQKEQLVFVDTPGIHKSSNHLDRYMMKYVRSTVEDVNIILYLVDSSVPTDNDEKKYIQKLRDEEKEIIVVHTKCDKPRKSDLVADIEVSVKDENSLKKLLAKILEKLPNMDEKCFMYDEEDLTDKSVKFIVGEYIREATLRHLSDEIPHGIAVEITEFQEKENLVKISADIICERETHKGMIIGKGGQMLKKIGQEARVDAEELLQSKVFLSLFVKVVEDWRNKPNKFSTLGY